MSPPPYAHLITKAKMGHVHEINRHKLCSGVLAVIPQDWVGVPDGAIAHAYGVTVMGSLRDVPITEGGSIFFTGCWPGVPDPSYLLKFLWSPRVPF